jgi:hypothetical protein
VREREYEKFETAHPDLTDDVAKWRAEHPHGSLVDAVTDLELWPRNPRDRDAQWYVWRRLYDQGDPVALQGFAAMRVPAAKRPPAGRQP